MKELYFDLISAKDVEGLLTNMNYSNLEYNGIEGEETYLDGSKFILYIGEIDTTYEIKVQVLSSTEVKILDRMLDEKHYVYQGKARKIGEEWKVSNA